jgi:COP9 signalosome complex subunit 4
MPHQRAVAAHGFTVPERTLLEHNLVAVSEVYDNIRVADLARILQLDPARAEKV